MNAFDKLRVWLASLIVPKARYDGATYSTTRSYIQEAVQSARFDVNDGNRTELMRKARNFEKNNAVVQRMADLWEQYTVGSGLMVQPASSDDRWNKAAGEYWAEWSELPDIFSRQPLGTLLGMMARGWFVDGEQFALLTTGSSGIPRLQVVEAHLIGTPPQYKDDPLVMDGVRVAPDTLRPIAFYVGTERARREMTYTQVDADKVLQVFEPSRPGQLRGLSMLHAVINDIHDLDDLQILEMRAAKQAADITNVVKRTQDEVDPLGLRQARVSKSIAMSDGSTATQTATQYYADVVGGRPVLLRPGDDFQQFRSERPSVAVREYWRYLAEKICIGVGLPYVIVFPDSMQGTVYRGAIDMAASFFRLRSAVMQSAVRRIYGYVMSWARYKVPALRDSPADWRRIRISPPRAPNVDIGYSADALAKGLANMTTTWDEHYSSLGHDWRDRIDAYATEIEYIKSKGLTPAFGQPQQPQPQNQGEEDDASVAQNP